MLYFKTPVQVGTETLVLEVTSDHSKVQADCQQTLEHVWVDRWSFKTFQIAEQFAAAATKFANDASVTYIATDAGEWVSPRFDVIQAPRVGDKVSKAFNGDYYPEGEIVKISGSLRRIVTDTGAVFYRRRNSGAWVAQGGTWSMVQGHINERNPSF